jgi:hypothetical protein
MVSESKTSSASASRKDFVHTTSTACAGRNKKNKKLTAPGVPVADEWRSVTFQIIGSKDPNKRYLYKFSDPNIKLFVDFVSEQYAADPEASRYSLIEKLECNGEIKTTQEFIKHVDCAAGIILVRMNHAQTIWSVHDIGPVLAREWMDPAGLDNDGSPLTRAFLADRVDHLQQMVVSSGADILRRPINSWADCRLSCLNGGEVKKRSAGIWLTGWHVDVCANCRHERIEQFTSDVLGYGTLCLALLVLGAVIFAQVTHPGRCRVEMSNCRLTPLVRMHDNSTWIAKTEVGCVDHLKDVHSACGNLLTEPIVGYWHSGWFTLGHEEEAKPWKRLLSTNESFTWTKQFAALPAQVPAEYLRYLDSSGKTEADITAVYDELESIGKAVQGMPRKRSY